MLVSFLIATTVQRSLVTAAVLHPSSVCLVAKVIQKHALLPIPALQSTCHLPKVSMARTTLGGVQYNVLYLVV